MWSRTMDQPSLVPNLKASFRETEFDIRPLPRITLRLMDWQRGGPDNESWTEENEGRQSLYQAIQVPSVLPNYSAKHDRGCPSRIVDGEETENCPRLYQARPGQEGREGAKATEEVA